MALEILHDLVGVDDVSNLAGYDAMASSIAEKW